MKRLKSPPFIDPRLINSLPCSGIVFEGNVCIESTCLIFEEEPYPHGTEVQVFISNRNLACRSLNEIEAERKQFEVQRENERQERERKELERKKADKAFNDSLDIPVRWMPEIKPVLSGLTENSWGDGTKRNTVIHVLLLEDLDEGRLHRRKQQPLCGKDMGRYRELTYREAEYCLGRVTCKECLKIAKRWRPASKDSK